MQWLIMNMTLLSTVPDGKPLRIHTLTGDALFAVWLPSPQHLETQHLPELNLCILTWIIPHGLNVTNATPHFIFSVGPGNPCRLSETNISYAHSFVADSFRPFSVCVLLALPVPLDVCSFRLFRLCYVLLALKMAGKKMCPGTPGKKKSPQRGRPSGRPVASWNLTACPPQVIQPDTTRYVVTSFFRY